MTQKTNYIFPKSIADSMAKVNVQLQLEAAMMSMVFILFGLITSAVYTIGFTDFSIWIKGIVGINVVAGLFYMISGLTTTYQQYKTYIEALNIQEELNTPVPIESNQIIQMDDKLNERGLEENGS